jgi:hypothetical protein
MSEMPIVIQAAFLAGTLKRLRNQNQQAAIITESLQNVQQKVGCTFCNENEKRS